LIDARVKDAVSHALLEKGVPAQEDEYRATLSAAIGVVGIFSIDTPLGEYLSVLVPKKVS